MLHFPLISRAFQLPQHPTSDPSSAQGKRSVESCKFKRSMITLYQNKWHRYPKGFYPLLLGKNWSVKTTRKQHPLASWKTLLRNNYHISLNFSRNFFNFSFMVQMSYTLLKFSHLFFNVVLVGLEICYDDWVDLGLYTFYLFI